LLGLAGGKNCGRTSFVVLGPSCCDSAADFFYSLSAWVDRRMEEIFFSGSIVDEKFL
jgi:hypothetical protein